jgi:hypothetical protein
MAWGGDSGTDPTSLVRPEAAPTPDPVEPDVE